MNQQQQTYAAIDPQGFSVYFPAWSKEAAEAFGKRKGYRQVGLLVNDRPRYKEEEK